MQARGARNSFIQCIDKGLTVDESVVLHKERTEAKRVSRVHTPAHEAASNGQVDVLELICLHSGKEVPRSGSHAAANGS